MRNYVTTIDPILDLFFPNEVSNKYDYMMDTDIIERKNEYIMKVNLPNIKKEEIKVSMNNGYLTIEARQNKDSIDEKETYLLKERKYGSYSRSYYLGEDIHLSDISGKLNDGVLCLAIKKPNMEEIKKAHYIEIQ